MEELECWMDEDAAEQKEQWQSGEKTNSRVEGQSGGRFGQINVGISDTKWFRQAVYAVEWYIIPHSWRLIQLVVTPIECNEAVGIVLDLHMTVA